MRARKPQQSLSSSEPNEKRLQDWILAQLKDRYPDDLWERRNVIRVAAEDRFIRANAKGTADISGVHLGQYFEFEVKRPGEPQTKDQVARMHQVRRAKGVYAVVYSPSMAFAAIEAWLVGEGL